MTLDDLLALLNTTHGTPENVTTPYVDEWVFKLQNNVTICVVKYAYTEEEPWVVIYVRDFPGDIVVSSYDYDVDSIPENYVKRYMRWANEVAQGIF